MPYNVKDISLAEQGELKIEWAESRMPVMMKLKEIYQTTKPLNGIKVAACLHVTKETAVLAKTMKAAGADVYLCASNPLSTQDDVAAALAKNHDINVFAWRGLSNEEYYENIRQVLSVNPQILIDDGADLHFTLHNNYYDGVIGGTEETTTGVIRLRAMADDGKVKYPIMAVNDAETKWDFDNIYGTGQSTLDGIMRATNILLAGKILVVAGYGHCGKGVATRARGMGSKVIVVEVDSIRALKARMDGFDVMSMRDAAEVGDIFITATGCKDVITEYHMRWMKDGAILANTGHFNVEINVEDLKKLSKGTREIRPNNTEYTLYNGNRLFLIGEGRLVNLVAAEGHPSEVMQMSFANQFLSAVYLVEHRELQPGVYNIPREQDEKVARIKLEAMGVKIDSLTPEQESYIKGYSEGTEVII